MKGIISAVLFILVICISAVLPLVGGVLFLLLGGVGLIDWQP